VPALLADHKRRARELGFDVRDRHNLCRAPMSPHRRGHPVAVLGGQPETRHWQAALEEIGREQRRRWIEGTWRKLTNDPWYLPRRPCCHSGRLCQTAGETGRGPACSGDRRETGRGPACSGDRHRPAVPSRPCVWAWRKAWMTLSLRSCVRMFWPTGVPVAVRRPACRAEAGR
jgi:hypothetical protein